ncbi:hypothetical protein IMZ31_24295 (plasmid) [Pontibacillus sp. ALD_SL1]|uniref:hypothetical protein n=1 Tax=Pontibacillus sp. ALD_SL1 TaxID=2777185 RepID=UPI001A95C0A2|nr:hypothetical protein [Pontibacillus sp. ALD_SL1]QST02574.1 hypothetical protein IMZ31_24295 [Pontibacillus sp. ALD_SL1]
MMVTIEKKRNGSHVVGVDSTEKYALINGNEKRLAQNEINEIVSNYELAWQEDHEQTEELENLHVGKYVVNEGDWTYTITIK